MTDDTTRYYIRFRVKRGPWFYLSEDFTRSVMPNRAAKFRQLEAQQIVADGKRDGGSSMEWQIRPYPR